ncbi:cation:proton antiporter [Candidatus Gottesmanbacteria bacterium]|nr:cation:proton antiporter [Candidatus Gottesmanbacteria bacterium]
MTPQNLSFATTLLLLFLSAFIGGWAAQRLRLPTFLGFIIGGLIIGSGASQFIDHQFITSISDIGVTLLLFTIGVEFPISQMKKLFSRLLLVVCIQLSVVFFLFLFVVQLMGFSFFTALIIAMATSISSTAVVVKSLSEKAQLDTLYGQIATGWLILQDFSVIPIIIVLSTISIIIHETTPSTWITVSIIAYGFAKTAVVVSLFLLVGRFGLGRIFHTIAKLASRELYLLAIIGLILFVSVLFHAIGLSVALGAFIAGILIADTSQNHAIFAEIRPLRDLFAIIFFVSIGMTVPFDVVSSYLPKLLILTLLVLLIKFIVITTLLRTLGFHRKNAFIVGITLTQMSEFGFILAKQGVQLGFLTAGSSQFLTVLTFFTILVSTPLLSSAERLYHWFYRTFGTRLPKIFPEKNDLTAVQTPYPFDGHVVVCGYGRVGKYIGRAFEMTQIPFLVVDFDQTVITTLKEKGTPVVYGDPADRDVLRHANIERAKLMIVAIPDRHTQELVIGHALTMNKRIKIICRSHHEEDQRYLKSLGVHVVIQPEFEAALSIVSKLLSDFGTSEEAILGKISRLKIEHGLG